MKLTLLICTFKRPKPIVTLLDSVKRQSSYPYEILVIDGSPDDLTETALHSKKYQNLTYHKVDEANRGLTKQRNFGIQKVAQDSEIVCFLDDDTVLEPNYFEEIIKTFRTTPEITGIGGIAINENKWQPVVPGVVYNSKKYYVFEGYVLPEALRNKLRNYLGLQSEYYSNVMPEYSHGRTCMFPLNGKTYEVDLLIGMSMAFRKTIFEKIGFSTYFEGYGLYEDADFSIRAQRFGKNVINTNVQLSHYHDAAGRPNKYQYGKMVVRNGWYVWRVKYSNPSFKAKLKWHLIILVLMKVRFLNVVTTSKRQEAFTEAMGRLVGWISLFFDKPKLQQ